MYRKLVEYRNAHNGSIEIPEIKEEDKDDPGKRSLELLRKWSNAQVYHQLQHSRGYMHSGHLTAYKIEKLREAGLSLAPSYEEMYHRLVAYKEENGTVEVNEDDDEELFAFWEEQKKMLARHSQGKPIPFTDYHIQNLLTLGCKSKGSAWKKQSKKSTEDDLLEANESTEDEEEKIDTPKLPKPKKILTAEEKERKKVLHRENHWGELCHSFASPFFPSIILNPTLFYPCERKNVPEIGRVQRNEQ